MPIVFRHRLTLSLLAVALWTTQSFAAETAHPDFSGVWQVAEAIQALKTEDGREPSLKPAAAKIYAANRQKRAKGDLSFDPTASCISPGLPRILYLPYPFQIIQRPDKLLYLFEWNYWNRRVALNDKPREVPYPLSMGVSQAHWDGDTLVIDTIGRRADNTLLDAAGMPHSESLHVIERMRLAGDGKIFENRITIEDVETFTAPWTTVVHFRRLPAGTRIREDICLDRVDAKRPAVDWPKQ